MMFLHINEKNSNFNLKYRNRRNRFMELWKIYDKDGNYTGMKVDKDDKRAWEENAFHQGFS